MFSTTQKDHILVIDDDADTLTLLRTALTKGGFEVKTAACWDEVAGHLTSMAINQRKFSAIILDLMMPDRSGYDMLTSLRIILDKVPPVVVLSARCGIQDMVKASDQGASKYLVKPTTPEKLIETLNDVIKQSKGRADTSYAHY